MLTLLVCGGRHYGRNLREKEHLNAVLDALHKALGIMLIVNGAAGRREGSIVYHGADLLSSDWAKRNGVPYKEYPAAWADMGHPDCRPKRRWDGVVYDANAGPRRNEEMLKHHDFDACLAFPGNLGTEDMVRRCVRHGVIVERM